MQVVYSLLAACKSISTNSLGAYRLFVLAKTLAGILDSVLVSQVEEIARGYISKRQWQRDKAAALRLGLVKYHERKNGEKVLVMVSHLQAALILGATKSSELSRASVSVDQLFSDEWQAIAFVTWQAKFTRNGESLVSQKTQAKRTGIQPQMQRTYNKICGVVSRVNYAVSNISANHLDAVKEFGTRAAPFAFKNHKLNQSYIAWRLPSTRRVVCADSSAFNAPNIEGSLICTNPNSWRKGNVLFVHGDITFSKALKRTNPKQHDLYMFSHISESGAGMFTHYAINQ